ncbi:MAG: hypothetical protein LC723_07735, partial [Actinobacteria bacterium]|nr:hypothetical protein [Actinomycetota bacterium]
VLAYTQRIDIDEQGNSLKQVREDVVTGGLEPFKRPGKVIRNGGALGCFYGLFRTEAIRKTGGYRLAYGPDLILLCELSLLGGFICVEEPLLRYRVFTEGPKSSKATWKARHLHYLSTLAPGYEKRWLVAHLPTPTMVLQISRIVAARTSLLKLPLVAIDIIRSFFVRWRNNRKAGAGTSGILPVKKGSE